MEKNNKNFIKLNLNKERKRFIELRGINLEAVKEFATTNVLPLAFIGSLIILLLTIAYYFTLTKTIDNLKSQVAREKSKRGRILSEIKRLEKLKKTLETKRAVYEVVKSYNEKVIEILEKPINIKYGYSLQNFSLCAFRYKNCSIEEKLKKDGSFTLSKPIVQMDLILFNKELEKNFPPESIKRFTYVVIDNLPYRRICVEPNYEQLLAEKVHRNKP